MGQQCSKYSGASSDQFARGSKDDKQDGTYERGKISQRLFAIHGQIVPQEPKPNDTCFGFNGEADVEDLPDSFETEEEYSPEGPAMTKRGVRSGDHVSKPNPVRGILTAWRQKQKLAQRKLAQPPPSSSFRQEVGVANRVRSSSSTDDSDSDNSSSEFTSGSSSASTVRRRPPATRESVVRVLPRRIVEVAPRRPCGPPSSSSTVAVDAKQLRAAPPPPLTSQIDAQLGRLSSQDRRSSLDRSSQEFSFASESGGAKSCKDTVAEDKDPLAEGDWTRLAQLLIECCIGTGCIDNYPVSKGSTCDKFQHLSTWLSYVIADVDNPQENTTKLAYEFLGSRILRRSTVDRGSIRSGFGSSFPRCGSQFSRGEATPTANAKYGSDAEVVRLVLRARIALRNKTKHDKPFVDSPTMKILLDDSRGSAIHDEEVVRLVLKSKMSYSSDVMETWARALEAEGPVENIMPEMDLYSSTMPRRNTLSCGTGSISRERSLEERDSRLRDDLADFSSLSSSEADKSWIHKITDETDPLDFVRPTSSFPEHRFRSGNEEVENDENYKMDEAEVARLSGLVAEVSKMESKAPLGEEETKAVIRQILKVRRVSPTDIRQSSSSEFSSDSAGNHGPRCDTTLRELVLEAHCSKNRNGTIVHEGAHRDDVQRLATALRNREAERLGSRSVDSIARRTSFAHSDEQDSDMFSPTASEANGSDSESAHDFTSERHSRRKKPSSRLVQSGYYSSMSTRSTCNRVDVQADKLSFALATKLRRGCNDEHILIRVAKMLKSDGAVPPPPRDTLLQ